MRAYKLGFNFEEGVELHSFRDAATGQTVLVFRSRSDSLEPLAKAMRHFSDAMTRAAAEVVTAAVQGA